MNLGLMQEHVPFAALFEAIKERAPSAVSNLDPGRPFKFIANRYFDAERSVLESKGRDLAEVVTSLEEVIDPLHFHNRAQARGPTAQWNASGCFQGREAELKYLTTGL